MSAKKIKDFIKKDIVLCIAWVLAIVSSFIVPPDKEYIGYMDFHTLAVLFCLMAVMAGLQGMGLFRYIAEAMLRKVQNKRQLILILVMLCFFFSMAITNDVSLITFVPFTFTVLALLDEQERNRLMVPIVVLQTIAANMGSMLTPIGNPHNLYLFGWANIPMGEFVLVMLPYTLCSFVLLVICCILWGRGKGKKLDIHFENRTAMQGKGRILTVYLVLFGLCLLAVVHLIPYVVCLAILLVVLLIADRKVLWKVDYALLLTFVGLFIFIGNIGRIPAVSTLLHGIVEGNEVWTSVLASQFISNVPTSILLSEFTTNAHELLIGTNIGGLGTLIASMASLISFKALSREASDRKGKYFLCYTGVNVAFLAILLLLWKLLA